MPKFYVQSGRLDMVLQARDSRCAAIWAAHRTLNGSDHLVLGAVLYQAAGTNPERGLASALVVVLSSAACAGVWQQAPVSQPVSAPRFAAAPPASPEADSPDPNAPRVRDLGRVLVSGVWDRWFVDRASAQFVPASRVEVVGEDATGFQLLVNGQPEVIRGMGLNTQYTRDLTPEQRDALHCIRCGACLNVSSMKDSGRRTADSGRTSVIGPLSAVCCPLSDRRHHSRKIADRHACQRRPAPLVSRSARDPARRDERNGVHLSLAEWRSRHG